MHFFQGRKWMEELSGCVRNAFREETSESEFEYAQLNSLQHLPMKPHTLTQKHNFALFL